MKNDEIGSSMGKAILHLISCNSLFSWQVLKCIRFKNFVHNHGDRILYVEYSFVIESYFCLDI